MPSALVWALSNEIWDRNTRVSNAGHNALSSPKSRRAGDPADGSVTPREDAWNDDNAAHPYCAHVL